MRKVQNDWNTCYYSAGSGHSTCTHHYYCIFNDNRAEFEKQMMEIRRELQYHKKQLSNLKTGQCYTTADYEETKRNIRILTDDLKQLKLFEKKVKNKEVNGYGMGL